MTQRCTTLPTARRVPSVTAERMREMDRVLVDQVGLPLLSMMEAAGRNLADAAHRVAPDADHVTVLAGKGGNGGGGLAAARHLVNRGIEVAAHLTHPPSALQETTAMQARVLDASGVELRPQVPSHGTDLVLDALLGYSQQGAPRGAAVDLATWTNDVAARTVSLDVPTGLDPDDGTQHDPAVTPALTLTLALPKTGLVEASPAATGELWLADIGVPARVYERFGAEAPLFQDGPLLRLTPRGGEGPSA